MLKKFYSSSIAPLMCSTVHSPVQKFFFPRVRGIDPPRRVNPSCSPRSLGPSRNDFLSPFLSFEFSTESCIVYLRTVKVAESRAEFSEFVNRSNTALRTIQ